jgi:hypothetical protein
VAASLAIRPTWEASETSPFQANLVSGRGHRAMMRRGYGRRKASYGRPMRSTPAAIAALLALTLAACGSGEASVPPPVAAPTGSLIVLETKPCNWLPPPDKGKCDPVGLARIGLDGKKLEDLTPQQPIAFRSLAISHARDAIAWRWNWELWVMKLDGSPAWRVNGKLLPDTIGEDVSDPSWSPDGSEILYRWLGGDRGPTWYRLDVEMGRLTEIRMPVDCLGIAWAPDGKTVACYVLQSFGEGQHEVQRADIALVDLTTLEATPLTDARDVINDLDPDWSPDGGWLAFSRATDDASIADETNGIWLLERATGKKLRVAGGRFASPAWSPDGSHLAAYDGASGRIVIFARDGTGLVALDHDPRRFTLPRWIAEDG